MTSQLNERPSTEPAPWTRTAPTKPEPVATEPVTTGPVKTGPSAWRTRYATRLADGGARWRILFGVSTAGLVAATGLAQVPGLPLGWRLGVLVAAVLLIAERSGDPRTALASMPAAWLLGNGFVEHSEGTLGWHTATDYPFILGLLGAVAIGMCVAEARSYRRSQVLTTTLTSSGPQLDTRPAYGVGDHPLRKYQDRGSRSPNRHTV